MEALDCGGSCSPCPPTCNDGKQNGDEEGIDCGGTTCPACIEKVTVIPALSQWGLIILGLLILNISLLFINKLESSM